MKIILMLKIISGFLATSAFSASPNVVYGEDNRMEVLASNVMVRRAAQAVAAQFNLEDLVKTDHGFKFVPKYTLGERFSLCEGERFREQPIGAGCSAFLVASDILVTAGHCFALSPYDVCKKGAWVFDYQMNKDGKINTHFGRENVYTCKAILAKQYNQNHDYAVVQLDRPVTNRSPLKVSKSENVERGDLVSIIGFPSGLPKKVAENGEVLSVGHNSFAASLDAFHANSGSVVLSQSTNEVVGILVAGNPDYRGSRDMNGARCKVVNRCDSRAQACEGEWRMPGEDVSGVEQFRKYLTSPYTP